MKMKLAIILALGILPSVSHAQICPCEDGTVEYTVDCDGDGVNDACNTEDCGPCVAGNDPSEGKRCCLSEEFDPDPNPSFRPYNINLQRLFEQVGYVKNTFARIGPCNQTAGGLPSINTEIKVKYDCCNDSVTGLDNYRGSASWDFGSVSCRGPLPWGIPGLANLYLVGSLRGQFTIGLQAQETCDETNVCVDATMSITAGGGIGFDATIARGDIQLQASVSARGRWCSADSNLESNVGIQRITAVGTVTFLDDWYSTSVNRVLWEG
jgi:hypothetical protein